MRKGGSSCRRNLRASGADQAGLRAHVDALVAGARRHADKVEVLGYV